MAAPPLTLVVIVAIVGCVSASTSSPASSSGSPSAAAGSPSASAGGSPTASAGSPSASAGSPSAAPQTHACQSQADPTGTWLKNNPTVQYVILGLSQIEPDIASGNVSPAEVHALQLISAAFEGNGSNYAGKLARDTGRFSADTANYVQLDEAPNPAYASRVEADIAALVSDCPGAAQG